MKLDVKTNLPNAYIFDMDGTLSDVTHRVHFITDNSKDWDAFFEGIEKDNPKLDVLNTLKELSRENTILIVTGRHAKYRQVTMDWLDKYNVPYDILITRKDSDFREDTIIKQEIYNNEIKNKFHVVGVFDDRTRVVKMWRGLGLTCFQVAQFDGWGWLSFSIYKSRWKRIKVILLDAYLEERLDTMKMYARENIAVLHKNGLSYEVGIIEGIKKLTELNPTYKNIESSIILMNSFIRKFELKYNGQAMSEEFRYDLWDAEDRKI